MKTKTTNFLLANFSNLPYIIDSEIASKADVASSKINIGAPVQNARAIVNFCHCPPGSSNPFLLNSVGGLFYGSVDEWALEESGSRKGARQVISRDIYDWRIELSGFKKCFFLAILSEILTPTNFV